MQLKDPSDSDQEKRVSIEPEAAVVLNTERYGTEASDFMLRYSKPGQDSKAETLVHTRMHTHTHTLARRRAHMQTHTNTLGFKGCFVWHGGVVAPLVTA